MQPSWVDSRRLRTATKLPSHFSGLLNALDGVASGESRIIFMTTTTSRSSIRRSFDQAELI